MRYIFSIFIAAALLVACNNAPKGYTIKGTVSADFPGDSAVLLDESGSAAIMTVPIVDGKFEITGSVTTPHVAYVAPNADGFLAPMILENGSNFTFFGSASRCYVEGGGVIHQGVSAFENSQEFYDAAIKLEAAEKEIYSDPDKDPNNPSPEDQTIIYDLSEAMMTIETNALSKVINDPKSLPLARVFAIRRTQNWEIYPVEKRLALLKQINKEEGGNFKPAIELCERYEQEIAAEKEKAAMKESIVEGAAFMDFEVVDADGNTVKLSDVVAKNKYTILEFWASWCNPCRAEIPNLKEAYAKYKPKGLEIFAVSLDEKKNAWTQALEQEKTPWLNMWDTKAFSGTSASSYAIEAIPASYLISQDGKLVVVEEGALRGQNLEETLSEFLK